MANINNKSTFPDYYEILQCERTASNEQLKKSYQSLVLSTHPDKVSSNEDRFLLIQKAWNVLREPESRKVYDAQLSSSEHSNSEVLLYDVISLKDMECDDGVYTYLCRCGSNYVLEETDRNYKEQSVIIDCDECSFSLKVLASSMTIFILCHGHPQWSQYYRGAKHMETLLVYRQH